MKSIISDSGFKESGELIIKDIKFDKKVRRYCSEDKCGRYFSNWGCPPAVGSVDDCRSRCLEYDRMLLFSKYYRDIGYFDYNSMIESMHDFFGLCDSLNSRLMKYSLKYLILSNEGCDRCKRCTFPDRPCRFPSMLMPAIEGYGLNVTELAEKAGLAYDNGEKTITYFGAVLWKI